MSRFPARTRRRGDSGRWFRGLGFGLGFGLVLALGDVALAAVCQGVQVSSGLYWLGRETADYARAAEAVYEPDRQRFGPWKKSTDPADESSSRLTGFHGAVYVDRSGRRVLAFEGTTWWSVPDQLNNIHSANGLPAQYAQAVMFALEMKEKYGDDLVITGHSLGGGLAQVAAAATGLKTYTFNPANISAIAQNLLPFDGASVTNIVKSGDWLDKLNFATNLNGADKIGQSLYVDYQTDSTHSITNMADFLACLKDHPPGGPGTADEAVAPAPGGQGTAGFAPDNAAPNNVAPDNTPAGQGSGTGAGPSSGSGSGSGVGATSDAGHAAQGQVPGDDAAPGAPECREVYDPSVALDLERAYREALASRDYARLSALREKKRQMDLWKKRCQ